MNKPTKPNITIPEAFAVDGLKTDFTAEKLQNGFDRIQPDVLAGDNLNKFIDDTYKGLNYAIAGTDAINLIQEDEVLTVKNGELVSSKQAGGWTPSLLQPFWSGYELDRMDMLRADTFSWQDGVTYSQAYNLLLEEYNNTASTEQTENGITFKVTPRGFRIADATQEQAILNLYNTTGVAWYYILDATNTRFKLPRTKYGFVGLRDSVGNIVDIATSGTDTKATQMYLYFYVGEYTQSAIEQTAGLNAELFNEKMDRDLNNKPSNIHFITETYQNGFSWYRVYSDGWCEQGGITYKHSQDLRIYLFKSYTNTNYSVLISPYYPSDIAIQYIDGVNEKNTNNFNVRSSNYIETNLYSVTRQTKGYIS